MYYNLDNVLNSELGLIFADDSLLATILPAALQRELESLYGEPDPDAFCWVGGKIRGWLEATH